MVSDITSWLFLSETDSDGITGYGEATVDHNINEVITKFPRAIDAASHHQVGINAKLARILKLIPGKPGKAKVSACEQVVF